MSLTSGKKGLTSRQISQALTSNSVTKKLFTGVYARDTLSSISSPPQLVVCNTDLSSGKGKHWVVFFFPAGSDHCEFFDSLGKSVGDYGEEFQSFVGKHVQRCSFVPHRLQPLNSSLCGHYCLYFAYCRSDGLSMGSIVENMPSVKCLLYELGVIYSSPHDAVSNCDFACECL